MAYDSGTGSVRRNPGKPKVSAPARPKTGPGSFGYIGFSASPKSAIPSALLRKQASYPTQRYSSGKSVGSSSTGRISSIAPPPPAPPSPPKAPDANAWLAGDTTYKQQMDASKKALADYIAQMTGQQNNYETEYTRNTMNLADQEKQARTNTEEDYASRGLSTSGLFLKALSDLATQYDKQESALSSGRAEFLSNLQNGLTNFKSTQGINNTRYRNEALNRRAQSYNL